MSTTPAPRQVSILMFDDMELLDYAGPYEVFTTAQRMALRMRQEGIGVAPNALGAGEFTVRSLARSLDPVRARAGLKLVPDACLDGIAPLTAADILIVPGGDVSAALEDAPLVAWIGAQARSAGLVASVCTGAFLLARAGVLPARASVTTHWEDQADLRAAHPQLTVLADARWAAIEGERPLYTSAGISAGIDMSLHLVERLAGRALAQRTARQMDYRWIDQP